MALDTGNNLITLADAKLYLGISTGTTSYDERFNDLINSVSWCFNDETGRKLKSRSITEYRDGDGSTQMFTNEYPITSNTTDIDIRVDTDRDYDTGDKVDSTSIIIYSTPGRIVLDGETFETGAQSVKIVYTAGYTTIPYDLAYAAKEYLRVLWNKEKTNRIGIKSESVSGGSLSYEEGIPYTIRKTLNKYKKGDRGVNY